METAIVKTKPDSMTTEDQDRLKQFLEDLDEDGEASREQRMKAAEDMHFFYADGGHWSGFLPATYSNRVKLQFDIVANYKNRFIANYNDSRRGVEYKPLGNATDKDAKLLTGIHAADFRDNGGKIAKDNAVDEVVVCGYGAYKLITEFDDESDAENEDQRPAFKVIHEAYNSVIWSRSAKDIDKQDAKYCNELTEYEKDEFERLYPGFDAATAFNPRDYGWHDYLYSSNETIHVATRYEKVIREETLSVYRNLRTQNMVSYSQKDHEDIKDELERDDLIEFVRERKVKRPYIEKTVFTGKAIIEKTRRIIGRTIPIIPAYGFRGYVDGREWYKGLVRSLKDPQRLFNMLISQAAETSGAGNQRTPIFTQEQLQGHESEWQDRINRAYLLINEIKDLDGNTIPMGPVSYLEQDQLDSNTAALMTIVQQYIQQATGGAPQDTLDPDASGKAIQALLKREDQNTQDMSDNINNATQLEGVIYHGIADEVYTSRRIVRTMGEDGSVGSQTIHDTIMDEETGRFIEANTISGKRFTAYATTGPQYESAKEQAVEEKKGILAAIKDTPAANKYVPALIASILTDSTGTGSEVLKQIARQDLIEQGLIVPETDEEKAFLAQAQQPKEDPNKGLIEAASNQANADARQSEASAVDKIASAEKKAAETAKIIEDIRADKIKTLRALQEELLGPALSGFVN